MADRTRMTEERVADLERLRIIRGLLYDVTVRGFPERGAVDAVLCLAIDRLQESKPVIGGIGFDSWHGIPCAVWRD